MDSDTIMALNRPHITVVDSTVFASLVNNQTDPVKKLVTTPSPKRRKSLLGENIGDKSNDQVSDHSAYIELFRSSLEIGLVYPLKDSTFPSIYEADVGSVIKCPVTITNDPANPVIFTIYADGDYVQTVAEEDINEEIVPTGKKRKRAVAGKQVVVKKRIKKRMLFNLQLLQFEETRRQLLLMQEVSKDSHARKSVCINLLKSSLPVLHLEVEQISETEMLFKGSISYALSIKNTAEPSLIATENAALRTIFAYLSKNESVFGQLPSTLSPAVTPEQFYRLITEKKDTSSARDGNIVIPELECILLPYQKETLKWCLQLEGKDLQITDSNHATNIVEYSSSLFPPSGWNATIVNGMEYYVNAYTGAICDEPTLREYLRQLDKSSRIDNQLGAQGLLAEEMGLGKTVEMIALILLNKRPNANNEKVFDTFSEREVLKAKTTLIISPASISSQWYTEIKRHSPSLSVYIYKGRKQEDVAFRISAIELAQYDVVITTYRDIGPEIHFALYNPMVRSSRNIQERMIDAHNKMSPLVQIQFWRIILDEVQMVSAGITNTAKVAQIIPRVHAWGVTGTPVKRNMVDLLGTLIFLRLHPFALHKTWAQLAAVPQDFEKLFKNISIRHTMSMVEDEIAIPHQQRMRISLPFNSVEENNYFHLFKEFLKDCGLDEHGNVLNGARELIDTSKMGNWLVRLRQACCHARIGQFNRKALGGKDLKTMSDILDAMFEQALAGLLTDQRRYYVLQVERGQLLEKQKNPAGALEIWNKAMKGIEDVVQKMRGQISQAEVEREEREMREKNKAAEEEEERDQDAIREEQEREEEAATTRKSRLNNWLEVLHRCYFFVASAHFQLYRKPEQKEDEVKEEDIDDKLSEIELTAEELEHQEIEKTYYEKAELVRREILQESIMKVRKGTSKLSKKAALQHFVVLDDATIEEHDVAVGLESRSLLQKFNMIGTRLNQQAEVIDDWREKLISFLTHDLVDQDADPDGEEYEESLDAQEYAYWYLEVLQEVVVDRTEAITAIPDPFVDQKSRKKKDTAVKRKNQKKNDKEKSKTQLELEEIREQVKPIFGESSDILSLRGILTSSRRLGLTIASNRGEIERTMMSVLYEKIQAVYDLQVKELTKLKKEVLMFSDIFNERLEYYRQLQDISDNVVEIDIGKDQDIDQLFARRISEEEKLQIRINQQLGRQRYLESLKMAQQLERRNGQQLADRVCIICQNTFTVGSWTVCGHEFCRECLQEWWNLRKTCPVCKAVLRQDEVYNFTYRSMLAAQMVKSNQKIKAVDDDDDDDDDGDDDDDECRETGTGIYSDISQEAVNEIMATHNSTSNRVYYGSKIDFIIGHLLWLRQKDETTQVVVFSQWADMLELLQAAMEKNSIRYATVGSDMDKFKKDPSVTCFLLHAKSQSSGLTLVNATHVYLCEPLVNTALELQAISRIHRIGQTRETTVWMFTIGSTVEESIFNLSTTKRLEFVNSHSKHGKITEQDLDVSNSYELAKSLGKMVDMKSKAGEVVDTNDLWRVLFDKKNRKSHEK